MHCFDSTVCGQCRTSTDCGAGQGCYLGRCREPLPGDVCVSAITLHPVGGVAIVRGQLGAFYDGDSSWASGLSSSRVRDAYYRVELTEDSTVTAEVTALGFLPSSYQVGVLATSCEALHSLGSVDVAVPRGSAFVRVATDFGPRADGFQLTVTIKPKPIALGNHCLVPEPLDVSSNAATVTGDTRAEVPLSPDACDGRYVPLADHVYVFTTVRRSEATFTITPISPAVDFDLELRGADCFDSKVTSCDPQIRPAVDTLEKFPLEPGTHHLVVHTHGAPGPYQLAVALRPLPENTRCEAAEPVVFSAGEADISGNIRLPEDVRAPAPCGVGDLKGLHYRIDTTGLGATSLVATVTSPPGNFPELRLATGCPTFTSVSCERAYTVPDGGTALEAPFLAEGVHDLFVTGGDGPFSVHLVRGAAYPPPANDGCAALQVIPGTPSTFSVVGDTRGADDTFEPRCGQVPFNSISRDVGYHLAFGGIAFVDVTVTPTSPGFDPILHMETQPLLTCSQGLDCEDDAGPGGAERMALYVSNYLDAGADLWVDSKPGTSGTFRIDGTIIRPPAEDVCSQAAPLASGQVVNGALTYATANGTSHPCTMNYYGPDLYYSFVPGANGSVTVTLRPQGFDGTVSVVNNCTGNVTACLGSGADAGVGGVEAMTLGVSRNVTYTIRVSAPQGSTGTFTLTRNGP